MKQLIEQLEKTAHGFKHIIEAGNHLLKKQSSTHLPIAKELFSSESYQARMLATYILGQLSPKDKTALKLLKTKVANDESWRVQEMLAKAFDHYCKTIGYYHCLPIIKDWLGTKNANVQRAVIEGLRIWTSRDYFKENPAVAVKLVSAFKSNESEYLRKSVGNALRDIAKKHPDLIHDEISGWDEKNDCIVFTKKLILKNTRHRRINKRGY